MGGSMTAVKVAVRLKDGTRRLYLSELSDYSSVKKAVIAELNQQATVLVEVPKSMAEEKEAA